MTDKNGRFEKVLVPRKKYRFPDHWFGGVPASPLEEIALDPGQTQDLGDVFRKQIQRRPPG